MNNGRKQDSLMALKKVRGHILWAQIILRAIIEEMEEPTFKAAQAEESLQDAARMLKGMMDAMRS